MNDELINIGEYLDTIREQLQAAIEHLEVICQEMVRLEQAEMYPSVPHEQWQARDGGEAKYLYMLFHQSRDGQYEGPEGKRKLYVGCDPERIKEARRLAKNRRRYNQLDRLSHNLQSWITREVFQVRHLAHELTRWPKDEQLLGPPGPGQEEPGCPNGGDLCVRCGNPVDHDDPHLYCSNCA